MRFTLSLLLFSTFAWEALAVPPLPNRPETTRTRLSRTPSSIATQPLLPTDDTTLPGPPSTPQSSHVKPTTAGTAVVSNDSLAPKPTHKTTSKTQGSDGSTSAMSTTHKPSTSVGKASTRTTLSTSSASGKIAFEGENNEHLCQDPEMNSKSWKANNVDHFLRKFWSVYPNNPEPKNSGNVPDDVSFPHYMADITNDYSNFKCDPQNCDIPLVEKETCKKHPIINFILFALKNFQNWQSQMIDALDNQHDSFQDQMNDMVQKFTVHDLSSPDSAAPLIILGAIIGALSVVGGESVAAIGAVAAGGVGIGVGIMSSVADESVKTLQTEIENAAKVGDALGKVRDRIRSGVKDMGNAVLTTTPGKAKNEMSAVGVLQGGYFADHPEKMDYKKFNDQFSHAMSSTIVSTAWYLDQVFIVKAPKTIAGENPCTVKLTTIGDARVCDSDGKTAYIFVRTDSIRTIGPGSHKTWSNAAGLDKLKDYDLDLLKIAKAAEWFQNEFGGWGKQPSTQDVQDYIQNKKPGPPGDLWFNLPVIDYEKTPTISRNAMKIYGSWSNPSDRLLNSVQQYIHKQKDWPYKTMDPK